MREVKVAFVAPGQGFTSWEDGLKLLEHGSETERIYGQVEKATGVNIVDVCESPVPTEDTSIVQPAALGIGVAYAEILKQQGITPDYLIGLSAGEFAVAAISGALSVEDAAMITQKRGKYQDEAAGGKGGVVTALHRRPLNIKSLLHELDGAYVSNFHAPNITGFTYRNASKRTLVKRLKEQGAKVRDVKNLEFPPHGPDVAEAQQRLALLLRKRKTVRDAAIPIIAIRTAKAMRTARTIRKNLIWQTTQPTRLNDAVNEALRYEVEDFYDIGPGNSITKILGYIITGSSVRVISTDQVLNNPLQQA